MSQEPAKQTLCDFLYYYKFKIFYTSYFNQIIFIFITFNFKLYYIDLYIFLRNIWKLSDEVGMQRFLTFEKI